SSLSKSPREKVTGPTPGHGRSQDLVHSPDARKVAAPLSYPFTPARKAGSQALESWARPPRVGRLARETGCSRDPRARPGSRGPADARDENRSDRSCRRRGARKERARPG